MLRTIEVDGFRSLLDFKIALEDGLNILVGSNGTGKSNFITFLDFIAAFIEGNLNSAIGVAHGSGAVFSKEKYDSQSNAKLSFIVRGDLKEIRPTTNWFPDEARHKGPLDYEYKCTLGYIAEVPAIYVAEETVTVTLHNLKPFSIHRKTEHYDGDFHSKVSLSARSHAIAKSMLRWQRGSNRDTEIERILSHIVRPDMSLINYIRSDHVAFMSLSLELTQYRSINIDPAMARLPTPVGLTSELERNGKGLAGSLYQLKEGQYFSRRLQARRSTKAIREHQAKTYKSIISWCKEVNQNIASVDVKLDFQAAEFRPSMTFSVDGSEALYPFSRISDGTVKWLALSTILFLEEAASVIEEPENFLHPFMQESFINLCRQVMNNAEGGTKGLIISTHSPTILDCCTPSEIIIISLDGAKTTSSRVANRQQLADKIANSRFGLGYYYRSGALYAEDSSPG
ncbi:hypothetical protein CFHF_02640 [Caulobacter flavus]|uniref:Uncharacterized protein n=1 Tax=Caulobacter flavus TaxID=1679497 RepID=A0A2N5D263_9CAUL|nr:ATP-binding protein [Caulobacter flavus]AYV49531.1 hypothetical protein C1707_11130 [Caulobacter flavus]PLR20122.1 hypothetical protein CFHF_02640 [Caulobacter flavus]